MLFSDSCFDVCLDLFFVFFCKQKTAYEMRISDWSSDVCSSDLQRLGRVALPVLALPAYLGDLGPTVALGHGPERRPGLDRLQLLGVADKNDLRARLFGMGQHALHLARADHAGLVYHQHVARA